MEPPDAEDDGDPIHPSIPAQPPRNFFQAALNSKAVLQTTPDLPVVPEPMPEIGADPASSDRGSTEDAEMTSEQGSIEDSTRQAASSLDTETESQTLALPTQSFVHDTYQAQVGANDQDQSSANLATGMDVDVDEDQLREEYPAGSTQGKEIAPVADRTSEKAKHLPVFETNPLDILTTDDPRIEKAVECSTHSTQDTNTAASKTVGVGVPRQAGDSPVSPASPTKATPNSLVTMQPDPGNQGSRSTVRSATSHAINPDFVAAGNRGEAGLRRTQSLSHRRVDSREVVNEHSTGEAREPTKKIAHRSTSTSRSGRVLPSKRAVEAPISTGFGGMAISRAAPLTEATTNAPVATSRQGDAQSAQDKSRRQTSKDPNAGATFQATQQQPSKNSMTGNARFQQKLQQINNQPRLSAQQMRAARGAALPPMITGVTGAINRPFVTPSTQEKEALLDNLISRSSSPSFARVRNGHPRAVQVQERRAHTGLATVSPAMIQSGAQATHGKGTQIGRAHV